MLPNAITSQGPYAGVWSELKSIDHALGRALDKTRSLPLSNLDLDRLVALSAMLSEPYSEASIDSPPTRLAIPHHDPARQSPAPLDLRPHLEGHEAFQAWRRSTRKAQEQLVERLLGAINTVIRQSRGDKLLAAEIPTKEFAVLREVVRDMLAATEASLA
jgi:hypothetical protein